MKTKQHAPIPWPMLGAALLLPLGIQLASVLIPVERLWGADALRYLHDSVSYAMALLPALLYLILRGMDIDPLRTPLALLLVLLALAPPLLWPMGTYFYGDGGLLIPQVHRFSLNGGFDSGLILNLKSSPLAGILLMLAMKAGPALGSTFAFLMPDDALYPFRMLSILSLAAVVTYILRVSRGRHRLALLPALAGTAGVLFYSGYVEFYTPVFASITIYLIAVERTLTGKAPLWPALVMFVISLAAHYMTLALLPSLILIVGTRTEIIRRRVHALQYADLRLGLVAGTMLVAGWIAFYFLAGFADSPSRVIMPIAAQVSPAGSQSYTLLSSWHLVDMLNLLLLLAPAALIALIWTWIARFRERKFGDSVDAFHAMNVVVFIGFAFFANASLGLSRDWDLPAPLGIIILLAALSSLRRRYDERAAVGLAMISLLLMLPWTQLHRNDAATAERFTHILRLDDGHMYGDYALSGYDALRKYRHRERDLQGEIALTKRMVEILDYPQHYRELSEMAQLLHGTDPGQTISLQKWMLDRLLRRTKILLRKQTDHDYSISVPLVDSLTQAIGFLSRGNGTLAELLPHIDSLARYTRNGKSFPAIDGLALYQRGAYAEAAQLFAAAAGEGFSSPNMYLLFGNALALSRQYSASLSRFEEGVRKYPDDGMLRFTLGKYYVRARIQPARAAELLRWCVSHEEPAALIEEARKLLDEISR
jgi:tetratricopeptide (TPR) repeat protein